MATAKPVEPVLLVRAAAFPRILAPPRPRLCIAGSIRASPPSTCSGGADELPTPLLPNARRRGRRDPLWHGGGFSLGVDLGAARTGLAVGRGIILPRPLTVLKLRGQKLELVLLDIAQQQEADELIVRLPVSADGREMPQSNKVRSVVGRLAVQVADRGLRVYLQDEHGTSIDALDYMISSFAASAWILWNVRNRGAFEGMYPRQPMDMIYKFLSCLQRWRILLPGVERDKLDIFIQAVEDWAKVFCNLSNPDVIL